MLFARDPAVAGIEAQGHPALLSPVRDLVLAAGERYALLAIDTGDDDAIGTSAGAYRVWCQIALPDGESGWVQAAVPTGYDTGSDGRPSSVRFDLLPGIVTLE